MAVGWDADRYRSARKNDYDVVRDGGAGRTGVYNYLQAPLYPISRCGLAIDTFELSHSHYSIRVSHRKNACKTVSIQPPTILYFSASLRVLGRTSKKIYRSNMTKYYDEMLKSQGKGR